MEKMQWKYQGHTYGIMDFRMKCSGDLLWKSPAIGNDNGDWDSMMDCHETGFKLVNGREDDWPGIVNVRAKCNGVETEITSNDDFRHRLIIDGDKLCKSNIFRNKQQNNNLLRMFNL